MEGSNLKRFGIVIWTANRYIYENPKSGMSQIFDHTSRQTGLPTVGYLSMKMARSKLWSRQKGRLHGRSRDQYLYSVTPLGVALAQSPQPPSLQEMSRISAEHRKVSSHPADWAASAVIGEMLTLRGKHVQYLMRGGRSYDNKIYDPVTVAPGEILLYHSSRLRVDDDMGRATISGVVEVISQRGELLATSPALLKPLDRRRRARPTLQRE